MARTEWYVCFDQPVSALSVQITVADATHLELHENLALSWLRHRDVLEHQWFTKLFQHSGSHCFWDRHVVCNRNELQISDSIILNTLVIRLVWLCNYDIGMSDLHDLSVRHYNNGIISTMASQITGVWIVYSMFVHEQIKENIKAPRHWPFWGEFTGDQWIPRTKGQ